MADVTEQLAFHCTFSSSEAGVYRAPSDTQPIWEDMPNIRTAGVRYNHEQVAAVHPLGRVALIGNCFVDHSELGTTLETALIADQPETLTRFPGSYATLLYRNDGKTTILSSVSGAPIIYYNQMDEAVVVGTHPSQLAGIKPITPDLTYVALSLLAPGRGRDLLFADQSGIDGVRKLPAGQAVTIQDGNLIERYNYEAVSPVAGQTLIEAAAALRKALEEAVASRCDQGLAISTDFSGGLDSTSLAFLTLWHRNGEQLPAFFITTQRQEEDGDRMYALAHSQLSDAINLHILAGTAPTSFSRKDFEKMPRPEDLDIIALPQDWLNVAANYRRIDQYAGGLHLTGGGGDEIAKEGIYYLADTILAGQIGRFLHDTAAFARLYNISPRRLGAALFHLAFHPAQNWESMAQILSRTPVVAETGVSLLNTVKLGFPTGSAYSWLTKQARSGLADLYADRARSLRLPEGFSIGDYLARESMHRAAEESVTLTQFVRSVGLHCRPQTPYLDGNVVRAAFYVPATVKGNPHVFKLILQEALKDVVPPQELSRSTKGGFDAQVSRIFINSREALYSLINDSVLVDTGILDATKLHSVLAALETAPLEDIYSLKRFLSTERWLWEMLRHGSGQSSPQRPSLDLPKPMLEATDNVTSPLAIVPTGRIVVPSHLYAVSSETGCLGFLDTKRGLCHVLDKPQSTIIRMLASTGSAQQTLGLLKQKYANAEPDKLSASILQCIELFQSAGLLDVSENLPSRTLPVTAKAHRFTSNEFMSARPESTKSNFKDFIATAVALGIGELLLRGTSDMSLGIPLLHTLHQRWCIRDATYDEAHAYLRAAQRLPWLGRLACKEATYTAALAAAITRKKVAYHIGINFEPREVHAWIEVGGNVVRTEYDGAVVGSFQSFFN